MKKYAYYHVYLTDETGCWYNVFLDQIHEVINHGLYEELEKICVVCIGKAEQVELFSGICNTFDKIEIIKKIITDENKVENLSLQHVQTVTYDGDSEVFDETETMYELQEHAKREDAYFLYFHCKGITAPWRMRQEKIYQPFVNYYLWRKFLEWGCIEKWETCIEKLQDHSCAGVNLCMWPMPHYSGTFWWTKSSYIRKLPDIKTNDWWEMLMKYTPLNTWDSNRNKPEMWIGASYYHDFYNIISCPVQPPQGTPIQYNWPRSQYENTLK